MARRSMKRRSAAEEGSEDSKKALLKKQKQAKEDCDSTPELVEEAKEYLQKWKKHQEDESSVWKFQTAKQVWLLRWMYRTDLVNKKSFGILVEYLKGLKGKARERTLEQAQKIVEKGEPAKPEDEESLSKEEIDAMKIERNRYKRALKVAEVVS